MHRTADNHQHAASLPRQSVDTVAAAKRGKRAKLARGPVMPTISSFLELHMVKPQDIVQERFAKKIADKAREACLWRSYNEKI